MLDGFQELCRQSSEYPCVLDAAIFVSKDVDYNVSDFFVSVVHLRPLALGCGRFKQRGAFYFFPRRCERTESCPVESVWGWMGLQSP
jgi:hypothetical protein